MTIAERILAKTPLPTHLDSATIRARVAQQIREQAFFSAQMTLGGYLKDLQRLLAAYADGQMDASQVRIRARAKLDELGFSTVATGLQDPRSPARLNLILKTNEQMAAGMAQRDLGADPLLAKAFPAWELVSGGFRKVHRTDWPRRWQAAGDAVAWRGALKGKRMVALKTSPIWQALGEGAGGFTDTLGNPYPPFAYGSSYEWSELSILEAQDLGLLPKPDSALNAAYRKPKSLPKHCTKDGGFLTKEGDCKKCDERGGGGKYKAMPQLETKQEKRMQMCRTLRSVYDATMDDHVDVQTLLDEKISLEDALQKGFEIKTMDGSRIIFTERYNTKYVGGDRKYGADPNRMSLIMPAVKKAALLQAVSHSGGQTAYVERGDGHKGKWLVVIVDEETQIGYTVMRSEKYYIEEHFGLNPIGGGTPKH